MSETKSSGNGLAIVRIAGVGLGVFWYAWGKVGFWWALVYGVFWPTWVGYRIAESLGLGR